MKFTKIIKPIVFICIFLFITKIVGFVFIDKTAKSGIELEPKNTIDYLVLGDSEAYTSISPMEIWNDYGFTGYNLGQPGQRMQTAYYQLRKALKNQSPKVLMLETNEIHRVLRFQREVNAFAKEFFDEYFEIFTNHNNWKKFNLSKQHNDNTSEKIFKGLINNNYIDSYTKGKYIKHTDVVKRINPIPLYYFNKIVNLCNDKGIQLILYTSPTPVNWNYAKHNAIKDLAKKNNLMFVDLNLENNKLGIDWSKDTYDKGDHLNLMGAKKVMNYMGNYLADKTNLIDHRQDKKYEFWHEEWNQYLNKVNNSEFN